MDFPKRKPTRLDGYDYSQAGAYFVTICTDGRRCLLSSIVGEFPRTQAFSWCALPQNRLTPIGEEVVKCIEYINNTSPSVKIDKYVVMPNHIHLIVHIDSTGGRGGPPLQSVIQRLKSYTTHQYGERVWQRSFHDHVVRNEEDYRQIWQYIDENPLKWQLDDLYVR